MTESVAIVSAVDPYPADNGKSLVIKGFLDHFSQRLGADHVHFLHVGAPVKSVAAFGGVRVWEMGRPSRLDQLRAGVVELGVKRRSLQETLMSSPSVRRRVRDRLASIGADVELIDTIRMHQHVCASSPAGRRIVYYDDLFSVRYERMLDVLAQGINPTGFDPLGQFRAYVPGPLHRLTTLSWARRALLRFESRRVRRSEIRVARECRNHDLNLLINVEEAEELAELTHRRVEPVAPRLELTSASPGTWDGAPDFVFLGLLSIAHNSDAITDFLDHGMPRLLELVPGAVLHIVGRDAPDAVVERATSYGESVRLHGFVEDLDSLLGGMCAMVNPLRFGSGVKIKTLDAIARGLPVIATGYGAEGISAHSVPGLRVVRDSREAAEGMAALTDPDVREAEARGAVTLFADHFSSEAVGRQYDRLFGTRRDG